MQLQNQIWLNGGPKLLDSEKSVPQQVLVYFITGNPGLIEYYRIFLTSLSKEFESEQHNERYHFVGSSLPGFQLHGFPGENFEKSLPLSLQDQVEYVQGSVPRLAAGLQREQRLICRTRGLTPPPPLPVILVGHSVGTYITLEVIAWRQTQQQNEETTETEDYQIIGGVCLFPTIIDLAASPTGKNIAVG